MKVMRCRAVLEPQLIRPIDTPQYVESIRAESFGVLGFLFVKQIWLRGRAVAFFRAHTLGLAQQR
jgi:hypothetical protein